MSHEKPGTIFHVSHGGELSNKSLGSQIDDEGA